MIVTFLAVVGDIATTNAADYVTAQEEGQTDTEDSKVNHHVHVRRRYNNNLVRKGGRQYATPATTHEEAGFT